MTESMVERVKHAIYDAAVEKPYATDLEPMARAAIEAMRDLPMSEIMSGTLSLASLGDDSWGDERAECLREAINDIIDAALKDNSVS